MAWTAPMTAIALTAFTAAQFNTYVRDNLNTTAPAVATAAGNLIVTTGLNAVTERTPILSSVTTLQTTTNGSYSDLATLGPTVTVTTGVRAMVIVGAMMSNTTAGQGGRIAVDITGASSIGPTDANSFLAESGNANDAFQGSWVTIYFPLTAGSNVFRAKYRLVGLGTVSFSNRLVVVVPF